MKAPQSYPDMTLDRAFEIVLELARDHWTDYLDGRDEHRTQGRALDLVTSYHLLRIKKS